MQIYEQTNLSLHNALHICYVKLFKACVVGFVIPEVKLEFELFSRKRVTLLKLGRGDIG